LKTLKKTQEAREKEKAELLKMVRAACVFGLATCNSFFNRQRAEVQKTYDHLENERRQLMQNRHDHEKMVQQA